MAKEAGLINGEVTSKAMAGANGRPATRSEITRGSVAQAQRGLATPSRVAAGIARSGAYNRTFTPFGFQAEERTYWEAPEIYYQMSPFMNADKMNHPLLLIHGEMDNNSGTFPIQSERYYHALKGHGATVRLVMLPYESHGYSARANVMHMLWEQDQWLERWLKE